MQALEFFAATIGQIYKSNCKRAKDVSKCTSIPEAAFPDQWPISQKHVPNQLIIMSNHHQPIYQTSIGRTNSF